MVMGSAAQTRAIENYRKRLSKRGMARFEVVGLKKDRELIREVARKLAESTPEAEKMRASMLQTISVKASTKGGLLEILRSWPLAELNLTRPFETGRKIDL
jgi:3-hydroxyisobutyrate dehydrogenase-like beta-hydroxyacid dehydrogenase